MSYDVIVIGGGHNGLVAAAYLGRAGLKTLVLERRETAGGAAVTGELAPGFRCSTLAHDAAALDQGVVRDLKLAARGLTLIEPDTRLVVLPPDGRPLALYRDSARSAAALAELSPDDAAPFERFETTLARLSGALRPLLTDAPPAVEAPSFRDVWRLLGAARQFRSLGRDLAHQLLRWLPMPVADLAGEWFVSPLLQAAVAAAGVRGVGLGPRAMSTTATMLIRAALEGPAAGGRTVLPAGGLGAVTQALAAAASEAGAAIRTNAGVARILIDGNAAAGVVLTNGEEIRGRRVVSGADPRRTLLELVDPACLDPDVRHRISHYRCRGVVAKINLALADLPRFAGLAGTESDPERGLLAGRIQIAPSVDYLERAADAAKYGRWSDEPYLDIALPSLTDPSLAPPGRHVMSVHVQYAPFDLRQHRWLEARDAFADRVMAVLERWAPGIGSLVLHRQVITPADLEEQFGLTGGHPFHGEHALDQMFVMRPVPGVGYRTTIPGLYLCGSGVHPGGGVTGLPGALAVRQVIADARQRP